MRCFERRLRYLLDRLGLPAHPRHLWGAYLLEVAGADLEEGTWLPTGAWAGRASVTWPNDPVERLGVVGSLPDWVAALWWPKYGAEAEALARALNEPGPITLRVRADVSEGLVAAKAALSADFEARGHTVTPGRWCATALRLSGPRKPDLRGHPAWRAGGFEVQDEGSQLIAAAVGARPGETVVDLCAGSGGKTLALADAMRGRGRLVAADIHPGRLADLRGRVRARGLSVEVVQLAPDGAAPEGALPQGADAVLVDAPCSALGTWRRGPDRRWRTAPEEVAALVPMQGRLLDRALGLLRPGGRLVYATCTLGTAENESVADAFEARADVEPAPLAGFGSRCRLELRPDRHGTDGFFMAAWTAGESEASTTCSA